MTTHVPDATIARSNPRASNGGTFLSSEAVPRIAPSFTAVPPPQQTGDTRDRDGRKARRVGLIPAQAGASFPLVIRDRPTERVSPKRLAELRGEQRRAEANVRRAEALVTSYPAGAAAAGDEKAQRAIVAFQDAERVLGAFRRQIVEAEASSVGRPTAVHTAVVREPAEFPEALSDTESPPVVVCLHDGCKGQRWDTEADMRRAHPTNAEMQRQQQAHVWVYLSNAPVMIDDADGEKIGYIAPIGRDGTTVAQTVGAAEEADESDVEVRLEAQDKRIADLMALVESLTKGAKKG